LDTAIRAYYDERDEENRLTRGASQLEAERTRQIIGRHLISPPATVLDIGGGAGAYALWLSGLGYDVHLVDPVERLVDEALRRSTCAERSLASCRVGDARALPFQDESADAVLLLGPLYHLTAQEDRLLALAEARRVLRTGAVLIAAAITRWASALDALAKDYFAIPGRAAIVEQALKDGQHRNVDGAGGFTTAFFHRPDELKVEVRESGLSLDVLYAVEGPAAYYPDFDERWADERKRRDLLRIAEAMETEECLLGASPHLLLVARK
jgi:ubiquinone/menaquinone biosynthesis C-methylase UbiE